MNCPDCMETSKKKNPEETMDIRSIITIHESQMEITIYQCPICKRIEVETESTD